MRRTHKAAAGVAEGWPLVGDFVEVVGVVEVVAQLGTHRHSPHEVRGDFLAADLPLPAQKNTCWSKRREGDGEGRAFPEASLTCQFLECRRRRGSWRRSFQTPPVKCSPPGGGRSFS